MSKIVTGSEGGEDPYSLHRSTTMYVPKHMERVLYVPKESPPKRVKRSIKKNHRNTQTSKYVEYVETRKVQQGREIGENAR